jgi:hypothetical protein
MIATNKYHTYLRDLQRLKSIYTLQGKNPTTQCSPSDLMYGYLSLSPSEIKIAHLHLDKILVPQCAPDLAIILGYLIRPPTTTME